MPGAAADGASEDERAVDQAVDMWLGQLWSLHELEPRTYARPGIVAAQRMRRRAEELLARVRSGRMSPAELTRLVHHDGPPSSQDPWWRTPLGRFIRDVGSPEVDADRGF